MVSDEKGASSLSWFLELTPGVVLANRLTVTATRKEGKGRRRREKRASLKFYSPSHGISIQHHASLVLQVSLDSIIAEQESSAWQQESYAWHQE